MAKLDAFFALVLASITGMCVGINLDLHGDLSLDLIRKVTYLKMRSFELGLPQSNFGEDVCLDEGCLAAAFGILSSMNASVDPCQDFYKFSCDNWDSVSHILPPPYVFEWGWVPNSKKRHGEIITEILEQVESVNDSSPLNKAKQFFKQCMGLEGIEEKGLDPLITAIKKIGGWQLLNPNGWDDDSFDWMSALSQLYLETGTQTMLAVYSTFNPKDIDRHIIHIGHPPHSHTQRTAFALGREIFFRSEDYSSFLDFYENTIISVAKALSSTQEEKQLRKAAKDIIAFEEKLAKLSARWEARYKGPSTYSSFRLKDFQLETDKISESFNISWSYLLKNIFEPEISDIGEDENVLVLDMEYIEAVIRLLAEEKAKGTHTLENYIVWRFVEASLDYSTKQMRVIGNEEDEDVHFPQTSREEKCSIATSTAFGMAVSAKYIEQNFDDRANVEITKMVEDLKEAFREIVNETSWMTKKTKGKANRKVNALSAQVGYPEWIKDKTKVEEFYEGIEIGESYLESFNLVTRFRVKKALGMLRKRTDRSYWMTTPHLMDANTVLELNIIVLPAGQLQPPFFGVDRPKHQNFGGMGTVIGQEIGRGFNKIGGRYGKKGSAVNWWDKATKREYEKREKCTTNQYLQRCNNLSDGGSQCINGAKKYSQMTGFADYVGLKQSFRAYKKYVERNGPELKLPGLESFSTEQLFFIGFANAHCEWNLEEFVINAPHSWRVNGLMRNSLDFSQTFKCPEDSKGTNFPVVDEKCLGW